ncbi:MAG: cytochrome P450, partial [Streptosporangiaceae bacterium]
ALLNHPDQFRMLCEDPSLAARAVDEAPRYDPPFQNTRRIALEDIDLSGYRIPAGSTCLGQSLARLQAEVTFGTLARRLTDPRLEHEMLAFDGDVFRALEELPVTFHPG